MSNDTPPPEPKLSEVPVPLLPADSHADWRSCLNKDFLTLALDFSRQFRLQLEEAVATLLLTAAHSLGESLQIELPHGDITPPFNLLAVTPEANPVWTGVPLRFLSGGIEKRVEQQLRLRHLQEEAGKKDEAFVKAVLPEQWLQKAHEAAGLHVLRQIADTLVCDQVNPPFGRSPIDRAVSLTTPRRGLLKALAELSPLERVCLEDSLLGVQCLRQTCPTPVPPGRPSFFWQVPEAEARSFFRQHGHWLKHVPFVMVRCKETGFPNLDADAPVVRQFGRLSEILFGERHAAAGNPRVLRLEATIGKPVMKFIDEMARFQTQAGEAASLQWVGDLALKFALILMRLEKAPQLDVRLVENGLELAKFFAQRRIEVLSAFDQGNTAASAETADLDERERRAYLKICESGGITRAHLRESFHKLSASDRDLIVARLLKLGLIRAEGRLLRQNAA